MSAPRRLTPVPRRWTIPRVAVAVEACAVALVALALGLVVVVSTSAGAAAQARDGASAMTSTTVSSTGLAASDPSPFSTGGIVFFAVFAVVAGGAALLYLRNRGRGSNATTKTPDRS